MKWKPVLIGSFAHLIEAELACSKLESEGIRARVAGANTISIQPYYSAVLGGVKLLVDENDAEEAMAILSEDHTSEADDAGPQTGACPVCGSSETEPVRRAQPFKILLSFLVLGFPLPFQKKKTACARCQASWRLK